MFSIMQYGVLFIFTKNVAIFLIFLAYPLHSNHTNRQKWCKQICLNPFSGWKRASCLIFSIPLYGEPYLCTAVFSFFVLPMSCYYLSPVCLCSEQQITVALFLSSGQPNVCFLFRLSASLPHCPHLLIVFASVCPLLFMKCKTAGVQRSSLEVYYAHSQAAQSLPREPCQRQEAFCHLCHTTSPAQYPAYSSNLINTSIWGWSDDFMCWLS